MTQYLNWLKGCTDDRNVGFSFVCLYPQCEFFVFILEATKGLKLEYSVHKNEEERKEGTELRLSEKEL